MVGKLEAEINLINKLMRADSNAMEKKMTLDTNEATNGNFVPLNQAQLFHDESIHESSD